MTYLDARHIQYFGSQVAEFLTLPGVFLLHIGWNVDQLQIKLPGVQICRADTVKSLLE